MTKNDHFNRKAAARARLQDEFPAVPEGFHRRMAETLDGLEEKPVKRKMHWSAILVAAVILTLATGAIAATYRTGWVDIDGNFTPEEQITPESTHYNPETGEYSAVSLDPPSGEHWEVNEEEGAFSAYAGPHVATSDELADLLNGSDLPLPVISEDMTAISISITTDKESEPYESIDLENGGTLNKYLLKEPTAENIKGYSVVLAKSPDSTSRIYMNAFVERNVLEMRFNASEQDLVEALEVAGYDKALYLRCDDPDNDPDSADAELGPQNQLFLARAIDNGYITINVYGQGTEITKDVLLSVAPTIE